MAKRYIVTLMAANRVGILAAVTTALDELGSDLQEVSQTVMRGYFTIIMAAEFPDHRDAQVIVDHIQGVCQPYGVQVCLKELEQDALQDDSGQGVERYFLTVSGNDTPGVIRQIATRLEQESVDITDLYAVRDTDEGSFAMVMELAVPAGVGALELQKELEEMGQEFGLSAGMQHENIFIATHDPKPVRLSALLTSLETTEK